jgi:asparagine synthase (glutamine-hydrolysing)
MCGICGQFNFATGEPVDPTRIKRMADSIAHRGPDDEGFFLADSLGLGFRRLSIIDLAGGHQPMADAEESVWIVFNGEIYNYPELRSELQGRGHVFRTKSDTEVIIHGYKEWGLDVFNHLNGMFGVAIWDVVRRRLVLARDAMGIKLVYYKVKDGQLFFGSEIRAITAGDPEKVEVDPVSLSLFLRYRFTPSPHTLYRGIQKLAAGTMFIAEPGSTRLARWYRFKPEPLSHTPTDEEATEELLSIYKRAVKRQLLSDVPVGLLLSGGVDSGLLLGLMSSQGSNWPTFTIGYGSSFKDDELVDALETARIFSTRHTSIELDQRTFEQALRAVISQLEEPIAASSVVLMYFLCQRARQDVKVALNGQGPDELFGGYRRHLGVRYGSLWAGLPDWLRGGVGWGIERLPRNETLKRGLYSLDVPDRIRRYQQVLSLAPADKIAGLFHKGTLPDDADDKLLECWSGLLDLLEHTDELGGLQFLEVRSTLPDELLMYADKMSMAHGLEVRVPYLDREVVEFTEQLGANFKVRNGRQKWLHRRVCTQYLPQSITGRKKRGFAVNVVDRWFRQSMTSSMESTFDDDDSLMYSILRPHAVRRLLTEHKSGTCDHHKILFSLVVFEQWLRGHASCPAHPAPVSLLPA